MRKVPTRRILVPAALLLVVGVIVVLAWEVPGGNDGSGREDGVAAAGGPFSGSEPPGVFSAPDFELRDAVDGSLVRMSALRGRVVVLTFLESRCTTACPLIASQLSSALRALSPEQRSQVVALAVSANPRDDTAASVRAFLRRHRAVGQIRYLNRPQGELRRVWSEYQVVSATETGDADTHSAPVRIYSRSGRWLVTQHAGADLSASNLVHDIALALNE
jgi:protein SCO1/2